jgi:signal transduction histidine kinase
VKAFVDAHGGKATVASQPGSGSVFTVTFPRKKS